MSELNGTRPAPQLKSASLSSRASILPGENAVIWTLWLTYGAFYFCRQNLSAAVPGMKVSVAEGGLGFSREQVGWILASLKIAYGVGQFVNGQLSERVSPRVMLAMGMFGSAALNVLFGLSTGFYFLLFVWATNGFCQSLGWTPCVRVAANWVPVARRGHAIGIIGTGYQITLGLTLPDRRPGGRVAWAGAARCTCRRSCWRWPACSCSSSCAKSPDRRSERVPAAKSPDRCYLRRLSFAECLYWTLYNPSALAAWAYRLGLFNACRYGFLDWGVTHLMETRDDAGGQGRVAILRDRDRRGGRVVSGRLGDRPLLRQPPRAGDLRADGACWAASRLVYDAVVQSSAVGTMLLLGGDRLLHLSDRRCCWSARRRPTWPIAAPRPRPPGS